MTIQFDISAIKTNTVALKKCEAESENKDENIPITLTACYFGEKERC